MSHTTRWPELALVPAHCLVEADRLPAWRGERSLPRAARHRRGDQPSTGRAKSPAFTLAWSIGIGEPHVNRVRTPCAAGPRSTSSENGSSTSVEPTGPTNGSQSWLAPRWVWRDLFADHPVRPGLQLPPRARRGICDTEYRRSPQQGHDRIGGPVVRSADSPHDGSCWVNLAPTSGTSVRSVEPRRYSCSLVAFAGCSPNRRGMAHLDAPVGGAEYGTAHQVGPRSDQ